MRFSLEFSRDVEKAAGEPRPAGAVPTDLSQTAKRIAGQDPNARLVSDIGATADPPTPGPVPVATETNVPDGSTGATPNAAPIRWEFPYAVNQSYAPRGEDRRLTPFAQLRQLADIFDILRIGIEQRKDAMVALKWDFAPKKRSTMRAPSDAELRQVDALREFFMRPDKRNGWSTWLRMLIEEVMVVDALSIYRRRTKGPTGGALGGSLYGLELIDGATIKPLIDGRGFTPLPPQIAYRQIIFGRPVRGGDCTIEQLMYRPRTVRTWTPYGLSPVECVLLTVNTALNRQMFNLNYYAEGNVPEGLISTPEGWTLDQIKQFQGYWDALFAGNLKLKSRLRFVGPKMAESVYQFKDASFETKFDEWLLQVVCAALGVQPQELGFTQQINKSQGEQQENVTYRRGTKPLATFIKDILDEIIAIDLKAPAFESIFTGGESEDRLAQAKVDEIYVKIGKVSIDELRARDGEEQIGLGPMIMTTQGPVFVETLIRDKDTNPLTTALRTAETMAANLAATGGAKKEPPSSTAADEKTDEAVDELDNEDAQQKLVDSTLHELAAFRRWAVKRVKVGKAIDAAKFESDVLPLPVRESIARAIAEHPEHGALRSVVETFDAVEKATTETSIKRTAQRKYQRAVKSYFADLATALSSHLKTGIEASE